MMSDGGGSFTAEEVSEMLVKFRKHLRGAAEAAAKRKGALASLQQDVLKRQQDVREADCDTANLASDAPAGEPQDHDLTGTAAIIANLDSSLEVFSFISSFWSPIFSTMFLPVGAGIIVISLSLSLAFSVGVGRSCCRSPHSSQRLLGPAWPHKPRSCAPKLAI
jgi:hypothetical protein